MKSIVFVGARYKHVRIQVRRCKLLYNPDACDNSIVSAQIRRTPTARLSCSAAVEVASVPDICLIKTFLTGIQENESLKDKSDTNSCCHTTNAVGRGGTGTIKRTERLRHPAS